MAVEVEIPRRLFTVEEYHRMADAGILGDDERVELIEGEIIQMAPIGPSHAGCVINATRLFITRLTDRAVVSPQNPVVIRPRSEPQPDLLLLRLRAVSYSRELPASKPSVAAFASPSIMVAGKPSISRSTVWRTVHVAESLAAAMASA